MQKSSSPAEKKPRNKTQLVGRDGWVLGGVVTMLVGLVLWMNVPQPEIVLNVTPVISLRQAWLPPVPEAEVSPPAVYAKALAFQDTLSLAQRGTDSSPSWQKHKQSAHKTLPPLASVDINHSSAQQLEVLPQVGPKLAQRILAYRKQHGLFTTIDELDAVKGIGPKLLQRIRPYLKPFHH